MPTPQGVTAVPRPKNFIRIRIEFRLQVQLRWSLDLDRLVQILAAINTIMRLAELAAQ